MEAELRRQLDQILAEATEAARRIAQEEGERAIRESVDKVVKGELPAWRSDILRTAERTASAELWGRMPQNAIRAHTPIGHKHPTTLSTGGADCMFDYLISECWEGVEGQVHQSLTGCEFKVYSHPALAFADAVTERATTGQDTVFYICSGNYLIDAEMTIAPPTNGGWVIIGTGMAYSTKLLADASTFSMFSVSNQLQLECWVEFRNIGFDTNGESTVTCIDFAAARRTNIRDCLFYLDNSTNTGIEIGNNSELSSISGCAFQGTAGTGVSSPTDNYWSVTSCTFDEITTGVDIGGGHDVEVSGNQFKCTTGVKVTSGTDQWGHNISGNQFECDTCISIEPGGTGDANAITITGNSLEANNVGIDFATTGALAAVAGVTISGNSFFNGGAAIGVRGDANLHASIIVGNTFWEFTSGNEISAWAGNGNEAMHNVSAEKTGVTITKQALADIGSPVGHSTTAVAAPNDATYVVATDQDATLPNSRLLTEGTGIDIVDGGAAGNITVSVDLSEINHIQDEDATLATQRALLNFKGSMIQVIDDASDSSDVYAGFRLYDAIVDSGSYTAAISQESTGTIPIYNTLQAAIDDGHASVLFRSSADVATTDTGTATAGTGPNLIVASAESWTVDQWLGGFVTMTSGAANGLRLFITSNTATSLTLSTRANIPPASGDTFSISRGVYVPTGSSLNYLIGDDLGGASCPVNLGILRDGVLVNNMFFNNVNVGLHGIGTTVQACRFQGSGQVLLMGAGSSMVACAGTGFSSGYGVIMNGPDQRVQASRFSLCSTTTALIGTDTLGTRYAITGNVFIGSAETGYLIDLSLSSSGQGSINGNNFTMPNTLTGAINGDIGLNISGNSIVYSDVDTGGTKTVITGLSRGVVTGNVLYVNGLSNSTTIKMVTASAAGCIISNNFFLIGSCPSGNTYIALESNFAGTIMASNSLTLISAGTGSPIGLNALNLNYIMAGNVFSTASAASMNRWTPISNSTPAAAISGLSSIQNNGSGLINVRAYRY